MNCIKCGGKMRVSNTRGASSDGGQYLLESAKMVLDGSAENFVVRERSCTKCTWRVRTLEVSFRDIRKLKKEVSKD